MFNLVLNQPLAPVAGYLINNQILRALHASGNHELILEAYNDLQHIPWINLQDFNRDMLRELWASDCYITTKYLATLWWGNVNFRIFNRAFSHNNMGRLQALSAELDNRLHVLSETLNNHEGIQCLQDTFIDMNQPNGILKVPYVGSAFLTKIIQFSCASHQINDDVLLPIIADRWLLMALFCEMTDENFAARDAILVAGPNLVSLSNNPDSYVAYVEWYNNRCHQLAVSPWEMEGRLFRNPFVAAYYSQLVGGN